MLFTCSLKFLNSVYLSLELQSNVGCFMMDPLILGPMFSVLAVPATDMFCIVTLAVLTTVCAIYSLEFVCSFAIFASLSDCYCILLSSLPCEIALFYHLDFSETAYFDSTYCFMLESGHVRLLFLRLPILNLPNILCLHLHM